MNRQQLLMRGLVIASFSALAMSAGAQTQTQGDNPRANSTPGNTPLNPQTSGSTSGTGSMNGTGTMNNGAMNGSMDKSGSKLYNDYRSARASCASMPAAQQASCTDAANKKFSAVDAKCQKLDGPALADCLKGADHGS
jgi:hypothetical protein